MGWCSGGCCLDFWWCVPSVSFVTHCELSLWNTARAPRARCEGIGAVANYLCYHSSYLACHSHEQFSSAIYITPKLQNCANFGVVVVLKATILEQTRFSFQCGVPLRDRLQTFHLLYILVPLRANYKVQQSS